MQIKHYIWKPYYEKNWGNY